MTKLPFVDRTPTGNEIEQLRLILSTYQDGSGMLTRREESEPETLPGWRDFERATALAFSGLAIESKWIYDVVIKAQGRPLYGISCKMRGLLRDVESKGIISMEISNAASDFWDRIKQSGLNETTIHTDPSLAGAAIIDLVESWHSAEDVGQGGQVDTSKSFYFVLQWERKSLRYQLFQLPATLPSSSQLTWRLEDPKNSGKPTLRGFNNQGEKLIEWYGFSGGQLKYFPTLKRATWKSPVFQLEPLPDEVFSGTRKAELYFPDLWARTLSLEVKES